MPGVRFAVLTETLKLVFWAGCKVPDTGVAESQLESDEIATLVADDPSLDKLTPRVCGVAEPEVIESVSPGGVKFSAPLPGFTVTNTCMGTGTQEVPVHCTSSAPE